MLPAVTLVIVAAHVAAALTEHLEGRFHPAEMFQTECGPVIGAHVGPGTVGVAVYAE